MVSTRSKAAGMAVVLSAMIAGSPAAAATFYQAQVTGTVLDADGNSSSFGLVTPAPDAVPDREGRTASDWQVGADATAVNHGTAQSDIQMGPRPSVVGVGFAETLISQSVVDYPITLVGTASDPVVPVEIKAEGSISWSQNGAAEALFAVAGPSGQFIRDDITENDLGKNRQQDSDEFGLDQVVDLIPGVTYSVELFTSAFSDVGRFQANPDGSIPFGEDSAVVDPTFTVVGAFASRWTIDGIPVDTSTPGGVPEPATWAMLIAGFGLAGASLRRRRAVSAAAQAL